MDVEGLLQSVIRFSNFMTSRLVVAGVVFYILSGFTDIGSSTEGFLPNADILNEVVQNYQNIFDVLGVSDFALLLILFVFLTTIHIVYVVFNRLGSYIPPAIIPLSGWEANDDVTLAAFDILREARGEEHTDEENQRLYEFKKKLREIEQTTEASYHDEIAGIVTAYNISKTFVLFVALALAYALVPGRYSGDMSLLAGILGLSVVTALYAIFAIFRANHERIGELRRALIVQFMEFARIWAPQDYQKRIEAACAPSRELKPAHFAVLVPVFGTLDEMVEETRRWRERRETARAGVSVERVRDWADNGRKTNTEVLMGRPRELTDDERRQLMTKGYRPVEMWLPDLSDPATLALANAEAKRIALADHEEDIAEWIDAVQKDMWEGEDQI